MWVGRAHRRNRSCRRPLVTAEFHDPVNNLGDRPGGAVAEGAIGGLASVAGGGKLENGAVTAAFGYLLMRMHLIRRLSNRPPHSRPIGRS
jgi:hypothetical protein